MKYRKSKSLQRSLDTKEIVAERLAQEERDAEAWRLYEEEQWRKEELADEFSIEREDC